MAIRVVDCGVVSPSPQVAVRPMTRDDVEAASAVGGAALASVIPAEFLPATAEEARVHEERRAWRTGHLLATDPGGSWVAVAEGGERDSEVVGVALAIVREGLWGLSLLGVAPGLQGAGIGGRLLAGALTTLEGCRGGLILASTDPRALQRYFRAGFALKPCVSAAGAVNRSRIPAGLRSRVVDGGASEQDLAVIDDASRFARGASHAADLPAFAATGGQLLVHDGGGWAVARDGGPVVVAARSDAVAQDLLWSCFATGTPGAAVHLDFVSADNDWAIEVALDMGLALATEGPLFVRGDVGPLAPYLPSGAFL
jgi:GNAT superfamily N-acetyltransferase